MNKVNREYLGLLKRTHGEKKGEGVFNRIENKVKAKHKALEKVKHLKVKSVDSKKRTSYSTKEKGKTKLHLYHNPF